MSDQVFSVHHEIAQARVGRFHWHLGAALGALTLFDGYDVFNPAYVIHYVMRPWHLQPAQAGLLVSSGLIGFLAGSALHGFVADRAGRRSTLLAALWIASIFNLATAIFGTSFASFSTLRFLTGVGLGVLLPLATTYVNEFAPSRVANTFAIWTVGLGWCVGGSLAGVAGVFATPAYGWRSLYWIGCGSFLLIPWLHQALPESVKYLTLRSRTEELRSILTRLRPERAQHYQHGRFPSHKTSTAVNPLRVLVSARYRRVTLCIWTAAFFSLFCIYSLSGWVPTVMQQRGETFGASFAFGALLPISMFLGGLTCGYLSDRRQARRRMIATWCVLGAASVLALSLTNTHLTNLLLVTASGFFFGGQFVLNNFTAQVYETGVRATAVGMELGIGRVGAILGPWIGGVLQELWPGSTVMFLGVAVAALLAAAAIFLARDETSTALEGKAGTVA